MRASNNRAIVKNTLMLYMRSILVMGISLYTSRVILRILGVTDFGIYNVVGGVVGMFSFVTAALTSATNRNITFALGKKEKDLLQNTFSASLNLHIILAIILFIVGEIVGLWFLYTKLVIPQDRFVAAFWTFQFSIVTLMISITQVPYYATLISHEKMSVYAYVGLYDAFIKLLIVWGISIISYDKLILFSFLVMFNIVIEQIFYRIYTYKHYKECRFKWFWEKNLYISLVSYAGWNVFGGLSMILQREAINIIVNLFFGPILNAARAISSQIENAVFSFVGNFLTASRPQIVKHYANKEYHTMYKLTYYIGKYSFLLMLMLILPLLFEVKFILKLWLYDYPSWTEIFVIITLITCLIKTLQQVFLMDFVAIGRMKWGNIIDSFLNFASLVVCYVVLKANVGNPTTPLLSLLGATICIYLWYLWIINHYCHFDVREMFKILYIPIIKVSLLAVIPPVIITCCMPYGTLRFIFNILLTEVFYFMIVFFIGLNRVERNKFKMAVKVKLGQLL